jgi:hypothetical protein
MTTVFFEASAMESMHDDGWGHGFDAGYADGTHDRPSNVVYAVVQKAESRNQDYLKGFDAGYDSGYEAGYDESQWEK